MDHWLQELSYTRTRGYYLENTKDYRSGWQDGDLYIQFPDLVYKNFQGVTGYKFNKNFSLNAVATQSERQVRSAGSFIPHVLYRYYIIDDRTKLATPTAQAQKSNNFELTLGAGYYHNFVYRQRYYVALGLTPGVGYLFTNFTTRNGLGESFREKQQNPLIRVDARAGLGHNGSRFFGGFYATAFTSSYKQENTSVVNGNARIFYKIFFGYRLPAPKQLQAAVADIKQRLNTIKH